MAEKTSDSAAEVFESIQPDETLLKVAAVAEGESDELELGQPSFCRICYNGGEEEALLSPCCCAGSIKNVHQSCLLKWLKARKPICELCQYKYTILKKTKKYEEV